MTEAEGETVTAKSFTLYWSIQNVDMNLAKHGVGASCL